MKYPASGTTSGGALPMDADGRRYKWGHFAPLTWRVRGPKYAHEVAVNPRLFSTPEDLLATIVHEGVHALLFATVQSDRHVGGVSGDGYYHRREFRDTCRALGLECHYLNGRYGWTLTRWPDLGVPACYRGVLALLAQLPYGSGTGFVGRAKGRPTPASGQVRLHCKCDPVRTIYVAKSQVERGGIICTSCGEEFNIGGTS